MFINCIQNILFLCATKANQVTAKTSLFVTDSWKYKNMLHGCYRYAKDFRLKKKESWTLWNQPLVLASYQKPQRCCRDDIFYFPRLRSSSLCGAVNTLLVLQNFMNFGRFQRSSGVAGDELKKTLCYSILLPCTGPSCKKWHYICIDFFNSQTAVCTWICKTTEYWSITENDLFKVSILC